MRLPWPANSVNTFSFQIFSFHRKEKYKTADKKAIDLNKIFDKI